MCTDIAPHPAPAPSPAHLWRGKEEHNGPSGLILFSFFIESFIKENRSLNLTSTDLQKAQGMGEMVASLTVVQMAILKIKPETPENHRTFHDSQRQQYKKLLN